jgi:hypothetical protein
MNRFAAATLRTAFAWMLVMSAVPCSASAKSLRITEMAVTTKIVRGNPIDSVHKISSSSVKELFCFTRLSSPDESNSAIRHVWYRGDEKLADYELPVKGTRWRTFSRKSVERGTSGDWRVEALDAEGKLLKTVKFRMN